MSAGQAPPVSRAVRVTTVGAAVLVAAVAAVVSYSHMQEVAHRAGEGWRSYLVPLSVDGLVVVASMTLLTQRRAGLRGGWLAWLGVGLGVVASLAANTAAAQPNVTAQLAAAWPAVAFAIAFELLLRRSASARVAQRPTGDEEPAPERSSDAPGPEPAPFVLRGVSPVDAGAPGWARPVVPVGPPAAPVAPFARVGDPVAHRSTTPRPPADSAALNGSTPGHAVPSVVPDPQVTAQVNSTRGQPPGMVDHPSPTGRPPVAQVDEQAPVTRDDGSDSGAPVDPDDPMVDRVRAMVGQVRPPDRPPGRRAVARELEITEYRASQLLAATGAKGGMPPSQTAS